MRAAVAGLRLQYCGCRATVAGKTPTFSMCMLIMAMHAVTSVVSDSCC